MPAGWISLLAGLRKRRCLVQGGKTVIDDTADAIGLRTLDQVVARAQALSRVLVQAAGACVDDFLADRMREADAE